MWQRRQAKREVSAFPGCGQLHPLYAHQPLWRQYRPQLVRLQEPLLGGQWLPVHLLGFGKCPCLAHRERDLEEQSRLPYRIL